jgi:hypothetical protein
MALADGTKRLCLLLLGWTARNGNLVKLLGQTQAVVFRIADE